MLKPDPKSKRVDGSGTRPPGTPATLLPSVVPKENVALLTSEAAVTPTTCRSNVAVPAMKGL